MGLAASSGRDNDDLVDKLVEANIIVTHRVETVLRLVDRGRFFPEEGRDIAYKDLAWKSDFGSPGRIHISAPCIYANVLEYLDLQEGNSFLNIGSGTGYLSTVAGYLLGSTGTNHGIEIHSNIVQYARGLANDTLHRPETQCYDWAMPEFTCGNGLFLSPSHYGKYDRVYCGAAVPASHRRILWELLKIGGILVMPYDDQLQQVRRKATDVFEVKIVTSVSFSDFILPTEEETSKALYSSAPPFGPLPTLQYLCASIVRKYIRSSVGSTHEIHIRDFVSQQPKRARENIAVIEYRDGEQPVVEEAHHRHPQFREIFAIVGPEFDRRDFAEEDENDDGEDLPPEERRRLMRERRREWFRQHVRAHVANRAARRRHPRQRGAQEEVNVEPEDDHNDGMEMADQNDNSESSGSGSIFSTTSSDQSALLQDVAETNSDGGASSTGRSKKRSLLEHEGESSLSAKRRNDEDNRNAERAAAPEADLGTDYEMAQNIQSQNSCGEQEVSPDRADFHQFGEDMPELEHVEPAEELGKFAETLTDEIIEQSQVLLGQETKNREETGADSVDKGEEAKFLGGRQELFSDSSNFQSDTMMDSGPVVQHFDGEGCVQKVNVNRSSNHSVQDGNPNVYKGTNEQKQANNINSNVQCNKLEETGNTSEADTEAVDSYGNAHSPGDEMVWHNNKLFKSKAETNSADKHDLNAKLANTGSSPCSLEDSKTAEAGSEQDDRSSVTGIAEMENSNDGICAVSSSSDAKEPEDVTQRDDNKDVVGDDGNSTGSEHRLYPATRAAMQTIGSVIEQAAAADRDAESNDEDSDLSDDEYHDAMDDEEMPSRRRDVVPDELQSEEEKKRERARLEERERQQKDIEKFAFLFERHVTELPLNNALKHYIKYLC